MNTFPWCPRTQTSDQFQSIDFHNKYGYLFPLPVSFPLPSARILSCWSLLPCSMIQTFIPKNSVSQSSRIFLPYTSKCDTYFLQHPKNPQVLWLFYTDMYSIIYIINILSSLVPVANACNPSYSGGRDEEDCSSKPAWANSLGDSISEIPNTKKGWWSGPRVGPKFKPQYRKKN
jgi:hypothetical protein